MFIETYLTFKICKGTNLKALAFRFFWLKKIYNLLQTKK